MPSALFFFLRIALAILGLLWFHPSIWFLTLMFINGWNWDLFLLVKMTRLEWKTLFTPDIVNLAKQLPHSLDVTLKEHSQNS